MKIEEERLSEKIHDLEYKIKWEEGECTLHFDEVWRAFEIVGKTSIQESLAKMRLETIGVIPFIRRAREDYMNAQPDAVQPVVNAEKIDDKYLFVYMSVDDASRVAALTKEKAEVFIKEYIVGLLKEIEFWKISAWLYSWLTLTKDKGLVSFLQRSGFCFNVIPEPFLQKHGVFLKPGKVLDLLLKPGYNKEVFASYFQEELLKNKPDLESVRVSGKPSSVYIKGGSFESCMKDKPARYFQIYDDIANCEIAYIVDEYDTLLARALLWRNVYNNINGKIIPKLMDRIYYHSQRELATMKVWAKKNGYLYKVQQKLNEDRWYTPEMEMVTLKELSVETGFELADDHYSAVPYVDTFDVAVRGDSELYSYIPESDEPCVHMTSTKGYAEWLAEGDVERCTHCGTVIENEEDCSWYDDDPYCERCFDNRFCTCDECGNAIPVDEANQGVFDGDDRCYCEDCTKNLGFEYEDWSSEWYSDLVSALFFNRRTGETKLIKISRERIKHDNVYDWRQCLECGTWYVEWDTGENYRCVNCQEDDE